MTILVTGAAGFIGCNFVRLALENNYRVVVLDKLTYAGHRENLIGIEDNPHYLGLVEGDIENPTLVSNLLEKYSVNAIVNFAAESHVDRSIEDPGVFVRTNVFGTFNLLHCAELYWRKLTQQKNKFRFVQISTDEVFGSLGDEGKFSEQTPYKPNSPYSASKASGDHFVRAWYETYGLPTITTNCSNNYGPFQFPEKLIPHMIHCALSDMPLPVYGNGKNVRDWIHVSDHCRGIMLALENGVPGETYCFGGNAEKTNLEVVHTICNTLNQLVPRADGRSYLDQITFVEDRKGHDWRYAIDDTKVEKSLGYKRKWNFEDGITSTIQWYLENKTWKDAVLKSKI
ncbi:MAG: dTDP-glucose 4,6-dehydratase [Bdellovibrionales bacterium]